MNSLAFLSQSTYCRVSVQSSSFKAMCLCLASLLLAGSVFAQSTTGDITGRVLDTSTGEYIRNAEVRLVGTQRLILTEEGGFYVITGVPAGEAIVEIRYTGLNTARRSVAVRAGGQTTLDFDMQPLGTRGGDDVIKLEKITVTTERAGNAKAIMEQRASMNMTNVVATDSFGDVAEGNVGEFLKYLPGLTLDYVEADTRTVSIGGMDAKYAAVTLDGAGLASAASSAFGGSSREFQFEQVSINSIETIEVSKTVSADMDGDAPAGRVNLKTKSGFDRKGRSINYSFFVTGNSYYPNFSRSPGPGDSYKRKTIPAFILSYMDAFARNTIGFSLVMSHQSTYKAQNRLSNTYNNWQTTTPADGVIPSSPYVSSITYKDGPKITTRDTISFKIDYKISPFAKASVGYLYSNFEDDIHNRTLTFSNNGASATNSSLTSVQSNAATGTYISTGGQSMFKYGDTNSLTGAFDYKRSRFDFNSNLAYSVTTNTYEDMTSKASYVRHVAMRIPTGDGWRATRSDGRSTAWTILRGATETTALRDQYDWSNLANWVQNGNGVQSQYKDSKIQVYEMTANLRWTAPTKFPLWLKTGIKGKVDNRHINAPESAYATDTWLFTGGSPVVGKLADMVSPFHFDGNKGGNLYALNIPYVSREAVYQAFKEHPDWFTFKSPSNALRSRYSAPKDLTETIAAFYLMANARPTARIEVQAGLRYEFTDQNTKVLLPHTRPYMRALGWSDVYADDVVNEYKIYDPITDTYTPTGRSMAEEYTDIMYRYGERATTKNTYNFLLPSASLKYKFTPNFNAHFGYSATIGRVDIDKIAGLWSYDETNMIATVPNPKLKPDEFDTWSGRLEYYFEPAGTFSIGYFHRSWNGLSYDKHTLTEAELAELRDAYPPGEVESIEQDGYEIQGYSMNDSMARKIQTIELEYSQRLPFINGLRVFATFTRIIPGWRKTNTAPKAASMGLSYSYRGFGTNVKSTWQDRIYTANVDSSTNVRGKYARFMVDMDVSYRFSRKFTLYTSIRNLFNEPIAWWEHSAATLQQHEQFGATIVLGVKGEF